MTEEVIEQDTRVATGDHGDGAFEAAFTAASTGEEYILPAVEEPESAAETEPEPEPVPPEPTLDERLNALKSELQLELGKVRDTAAGRFGELNQRVQQVLTQQQSTGQSGAKLTKESMKRLGAEFPEMAEMLVEDLSEAFGSAGGSQPVFDPSVIDQRVEERVSVVKDELTKEFEKFKVSTVYSDWEDKVRTQDFKEWLWSKDEAYQERIGNSWDSKEIIKALSTFEQETKKAEVQTQQRNKRLEDAITPTTATKSAPVPDEYDAFLSGFKAVRG